MAEPLGSIPRMAAMARVSSPTFVGRRSEVETMTAALIGSSRDCAGPHAACRGGRRWQDPAGDRGQPASGSRAGALVLIGGCVPLGEGTVPFAPIREAMRDLASRRSEQDLDRLLGAGREELASLVPAISRSGAPSPAGSAQQQGRIHELILGLLERLAEERPTVLVLEDLHWADRSTLGLVSFLVRNIRAQGLTLIGTLRSDEVDRRHPLYRVPGRNSAERPGDTSGPASLRPRRDGRMSSGDPWDRSAHRAFGLGVPALGRQRILRRGAPGRGGACLRPSRYAERGAARPASGSFRMARSASSGTSRRPGAAFPEPGWRT